MVLQTGMDGNYVVPYGMERIVMYVKKRYNNPVIIITENGEWMDLLDGSSMETRVC